MHKWVFAFGDSATDGKIDRKNLLGNKGVGLAEMSSIGLPVPPGFTISTEACSNYYENTQHINNEILTQINAALSDVEGNLQLKFGDSQKPLLLSIRSGAPVSMPGMMDSILNIGLNDETVKGLADNSSDERFAYDSYRRLIQMYSSVVLNIDLSNFEDILINLKQENAYSSDNDFTADDLKTLVSRYKDIVKEHGSEFPQDVNEQLYGAIKAVFESWQNERAVSYRNIYNLGHDSGTAVNVQSMVFGNMGEGSATGVCFTRDPSTGENSFYGEFLPNAQGEDVVAGIRTPHQITNAGKEYNFSEKDSLEEMMPDSFSQLKEIAGKLEKHFGDMQDIEFTIQKNKLWILQCRNGKRTAQSAIKIAVDMVDEGILTKEQAVLKIDASSLDQMLHPTLDPNADNTVLTKGLPASPGAASGKVVFTPKEAEHVSKENKVILVRNETSPEDINGMNVSQGILTVHGGMTSHAAVVARGMGKPCITGSSEITIDYDSRAMQIGEDSVKAGEVITINGSTGEVMLGAVPTITPKFTEEFTKLMEWADELRTMKVRTNADTPHESKVARNFGAQGIGLCRTEHMFFGEERIIAIHEMILASEQTQREETLAKLLPFQKEDFIGIFKEMDGLPVTIRLLDPPLHEFLPSTEEEIRKLADDLKVSVDWIKNRISHLKEANPMLGHRGCRLAISHPEIYDMQVRAIIEAAVECGADVYPEIMIPLTIDIKEMRIIKERITAIADEILKSNNSDIKYLVGTMIELPRAVLKADEIAKESDFFSFGTNDLTQSTMGISRDDSGNFMEDYLQKGIFESDPFASLDRTGVGALVEMAVERGTSAKPDIKLGICGEHGGDPQSINFFQKAGLHYVSCSPFRVPIARLAAAQAALQQQKSQTEKKAV